MIITQTVEIPANRRLTLDLPRNVPVEKATVIIRLPVGGTTHNPSLLDLRGSCKGADTMEAYFKRHHAENERERQAE
jgi:hypothetical protein